MTTKQLNAKYDSLLSPLEMPGDWSALVRDSYERARADIAARLETIRRATETLAELEPKIAADQSYADALGGFRRTLCDELLALGDSTAGRHRTDREFGLEINLQFSIAVIDRGLGACADSGYVLETLRLGKLMKAAGVQWRDGLPWIEQRLAENTARATDARARLEAALKDPEPALVPVTS